MSTKTTYHEIVQTLARRSGHSQQGTDRFLRELVATVGQSLASDDQIQLAGFGKWERRYYKSRPGRHPRTGEKIQIPGHHRAVFKPFKALKEEVNTPFNHLEARLVRPKEEPLLVVRERPVDTSSPEFFIELDESEAETDNEWIRIRPSPVTDRQSDTENS